MESSVVDGNNGAFLLRMTKLRDGFLFCIASDGAGWEHVSVSPSRKNRTPTWREMGIVKDLFWDPEDVVIQIHPPKSEYVNCHPNVLHLWRKLGTNDFCERPPKELVGGGVIRGGYVCD